MLLVHEGGTVVPLLRSAAAAHRHPSRAGAGNAPHKVLPKAVEFERRSPPPMREMWMGG